MRLLIFLLLQVTVAIHTYAQNSKNYPVKAGESPEMVLPQEGKYFFAAFTEGTVFMRDGTSSKQHFNYSKLLDEMQFLTTRGDTLTVANPDLMRTIVVDTFSFYFQKGYLRKIAQQKEYILAVKELMVQALQGKDIGYGASIATGSINSYSRISSDNGKQYALVVKRDVLFTEARAFYIGDQYNYFSRADKKGFLRTFSEKKKGVEAFIKSNNINFNKQEDLEKLLRFCTAK